MALKNPLFSSFIFFFFLLNTLFRVKSNEVVLHVARTAIPDHFSGLISDVPVEDSHVEKEENLRYGELWGGGRRSRRWLIGSTAPRCTYECRGCRFKCIAEQVPVDANDPLNSAYRYRCVCHR